MEKLCAAALPTNTDSKMHSHHHMVEVVRKRLVELRSFQSRRTQLGTLCSTIPVDVVVEGKQHALHSKYTDKLSYTFIP